MRRPTQYARQPSRPCSLARIGPEIIQEAVAVLDVVAGLEYERREFGDASIDAHETALTHETLEACRVADAVLLAAVGGRNGTRPTGPSRGASRARSGSARGSGCSRTSGRSTRAYLISLGISEFTQERPGDRRETSTFIGCLRHPSADPVALRWCADALVKRQPACGGHTVEPEILQLREPLAGPPMRDQQLVREIEPPEPAHAHELGRRVRHQALKADLDVGSFAPDRRAASTRSFR
jgi:hypothetical protein